MLLLSANDLFSIQIALHLHLISLHLNNPITCCGGGGFKGKLVELVIYSSSPRLTYCWRSWDKVERCISISLLREHAEHFNLSTPPHPGWLSTRYALSSFKWNLLSTSKTWRWASVPQLPRCKIKLQLCARPPLHMRRLCHRRRWRSGGRLRLRLSLNRRSTFCHFICRIFFKLIPTTSPFYRQNGSYFHIFTVMCCWLKLNDVIPKQPLKSHPIISLCF